MSSWEDDSVQFPRLLAEIMATQDNLDLEALCESMDLEPDDIWEIFNRAQNAWEKTKESTTRKKEGEKEAERQSSSWIISRFDRLR